MLPTRFMKRMRVIAVLLVLLTGIGTAAFHFIEGWSWFDGFYMSVITFSTVGYQEVRPLTHAGRILTMFLIAGGVGLVYFAIGAMTQGLLEFELDKAFGKRRMQREIDKLSGHYIICGAG